MSRQPPPGDLLSRLAEQAMDDDYAAVAARRGPDRPTPGADHSTVVAFGAAVATLAVLLTVSVVQTRDTASQNEADREALIDRIQQEQDDVASFQAQVRDLTRDVDVLRSTVPALVDDVAAAQNRVVSLQMATGVVPVRGPGVRITVDNAPSGAPSGHIRDTDLQLLANGLWQAGAEAVAIGGQRLTARSAIRTAGEAITVNYRSLSPPYVVTAIGDPDTLPAALLETSAGQAFADLRANFDVVFELDTEQELTLPGRLQGVSQAQALPDAGDRRAAP